MRCACGSYAINHHHHGRDGSDGDKCDVCYWRSRAERYAAPPSAPVGVEDIIEAFDEITGLCRHLRQGGPAPEDLHGLSGALDEAIGIAGDMLAALAAQPGGSDNDQ